MAWHFPVVSVLRSEAVANSRWLASFLERTVVCDVEKCYLHMISVEDWKETTASQLMGGEV